MKYEAVSAKHLNGTLTLDEIERLAKLSWLAMGIYQYLVLHGTKSIAELGYESPTTSHAEISKGLEQLAELGLIKKAAEVQGGAA